MELSNNAILVLEALYNEDEKGLQRPAKSKRIFFKRPVKGGGTKNKLDAESLARVRTARKFQTKYKKEGKRGLFDAESLHAQSIKAKAGLKPTSY